MIESNNNNILEAKTMIVNKEGYYLFHSDKKKNWNQLSASKETLNLRTDFGEKIASRILSNSRETIEELGNNIIAQAKVLSTGQGIGNEYTLIVSILKGEIFKSINKGILIIGGLLLIFLILSFFLALMATKHFNDPINNLINTANIISLGNYDTLVEISTHDEIQELAYQFNNMAQSLKQREEEINHHKKILEKTVFDRTKDLANEKNKLQTIFNNAPIGFILYDSEFRILSASAAIEIISGMNPGNILGQNYLQVFEWNNNSRNESFKEVQELGSTITDYTSYTRADGIKKYLEHILVPIRISKQERSILEIITDITERKRLQDMLIHSERLAATGELAAVIAHEIRNSLTSVRMIIQLLSRKKEITKRDSDSFDVALDSVNHMEQVVNDLLTLARPSELKMERANINEVLKSGIDFVMPQLQKRNIEIAFSQVDNDPYMIIDSGRMKEIIINLLLNASQAFDDSGKIIIKAEHVKLKENIRDFAEKYFSENENTISKIGDIFLKIGSKVLKINIIDNGNGIPSNIKDRIFAPFFTTKINGTGLGLTFVKRMVNQHGGIITVESKEGEGSRFTLLLPITDSKNA